MASGAGGGHISMPHEAFKILNFIIFIAVLYLLLSKKVKDFFKDRRESIRGEILSADLARNKAEKRFKEITEKLELVEHEISSLREQAKRDGEGIREKIKKEAEELAERVVDQTKRNIESETKQAKMRLQQEAALLAIEMAEEFLKKNIKIEDQKRLVDEFITRMERFD
jgi:F-type H+-transporting ATPase subunit b